MEIDLGSSHFRVVLGNKDPQSPKEITNSIGMKMVLIPKGTFDMGSAATDPGADLDEPQHQVTLYRDFYFGQFEVTQTPFH